MTSSATQIQHQQQQHQAKFRWTENLTCRFIQLRREHGNMFTGRKYSAQAGWEYILRQMREEFPTIMADVHYRVLKKKWSNLLQQYKELKNPVHGDKNKADDISWPFFSAIDEVLGYPGSPQYRRHPSHSPDPYDEGDDEDGDDNLNPQEFLCVSVAPDSDDEPEEEEKEASGADAEDTGRVPGLPGLQPLVQRQPVFGIDRSPHTNRRSSNITRKRNITGTDSSSEELLSRLPRATELTICPVPRTTTSNTDHHQQQPPGLEPINNGRNDFEFFRDPKRSRMGVNISSSSSIGTTEANRSSHNDHSSGAGIGGAGGSSSGGSSNEESRLEHRFIEFLDYTRKRDEENRAILMRMLELIEDIRNSVR